MTFDAWAAKHPDAARELLAVLAPACSPPEADADGSEAKVQASVRLQVARLGAYAWRNNVGATPTKCPSCGARRAPVRYGLANDSQRLNGVIKSSDLILAIPRRITTADVGRTIAQFGAIETKRPGWRYTGKDQEPGQAAWLALINKIGGFARFSTGDVEL